MRHQEVRPVRYGLEIALYRARHLCSLVTADLKSLPNVNMFKSKINHLECTECPCELCKIYLRKLCLTFPQNQLNQVIKLWEQASTFTCKFFSITLFYMLNFKVASGVNFRTATKHLKLRFYKNRYQIMQASIMNVYPSVLNPHLNFSWC